MKRNTTRSTKPAAALHPGAGFTLIELLVVIAVIAILASLLFPVFARAREKARQTACLSNSKQIGTAWHIYVQDYDETLPLYWYGPTIGYWHVVLQPYVKNKQLFVCPSARNLTSNAGDSCDPRYVADYPPPGNTTEAGKGSGTYGYNFYYLGPGYTTPSGTVMSMSAIDQPADTVALSEINKIGNPGATYRPTLWETTNPYGCRRPNLYGEQVATWHNEGNNIVFCDGHAKWMKKESFGDYDKDGRRDDGWFCLNKTNISASSTACPEL